MSDNPKLDNSLIAVAERILTDVWAGEVRLVETEMLQSPKCYRLAVTDAPPGAPTSVILKRPHPESGVPVDPDATEENPSQPLLEEWTGLAFLNSILPEIGLVPRFYGGDRPACIVVFEDLGKGTSLADALQGTDPDYARECLTLHAQAVAQLHVNTLGQDAEAHYWKIRDALGPRDTPRNSLGWGNLRTLQAELRKGFDRISQQVPTAFWEEYDALIAAIENPSPFRAYIHNDSCPDNTFLAPGRLRLIDFERGGYHLCFLDAVYCRLSMPHCYWANRLPDDVAPMVESAYRKVLSESLPDAADDRRFARGIAEACAYWIISNGMWLVDRNFEKDFTWGSATWRQRVFLRLEQFAETTEEFSHLPAMGAAARETLRRLKGYWTCDPMPLYPAFR